MAWMQTHKGRRFELLAPRAEDVDPEELAWSLARIPRFLGHTRGPLSYSVAEHSIYVAASVADQTRGRSGMPTEPRLVLAALLHDAHEAYMGDITAPVKLALRELGAGDALAELQRRIDAAIAARFGFPVELFADSRIKATDLLLLAAEKRDLMPGRDDWGPLPDPGEVLKIQPTPELRVRREFAIQLDRWSAVA